MAIPTISLSSPKEDVAAALRETCIDVGFFYLEGHQIPQPLLDDVFEQSKILFALPEDEKGRLADPVLTRGFTRFEEETLDPANQPERGDTKEGFYIGDEVPREDMDAAKLRGPNVWPDPKKTSLTEEQCQNFREAMERYRGEATRVGMQLVECFSLAVSEDPHLFNKYFMERRLFVKLLHYSAEQSDEKNGLYACGAHSDYGMITLLLTDDNPGLQVKLDGKWIDIPPKRGTLVVNIGDMFERWTNGLFRSTVHRVITPNGANERYSIPAFLDPDFDAIVECLESCCSEGNPPKYPPITAGQHLLNMYEKTHADFDHPGAEDVQPP